MTGNSIKKKLTTTVGSLFLLCYLPNNSFEMMLPTKDMLEERQHNSGCHDQNIRLSPEINLLNVSAKKFDTRSSFIISTKGARKGKEDQSKKGGG